MHAVSHSLAQRAHRAPPATRTRARWQPYNSLQSARSSPAAYLTPASSVVSASPTPPQTLTSCDNDRFRNVVPPPFSVPHARELQPRDVQKTKYVVGLVDQAVKSLCEIWHPQDIPNSFMTSSHAHVPVDQPGEQAISHISQPATSRGFSRNTQLLSPISPTTRLSPVAPQLKSTPSAQLKGSTAGPQCNLVPIKGFVHEVLRRSRTSGTVLQTALCYLEAIRPKVPELVRKEKIGDGVQGEPDLTDRIVQGDIEAEEWKELSLDSIMADFIHLDAAVDSDSAEVDVMATVRVVDGDDAPPSGSSFVSSQSSTSSDENADFTLTGLKSHLVQNLTKKSKVPSGPLPPLAPLPSPLLCPRRTFLASLILASKFTQDRCYSNKAWAKLSGLPPREIGRCERALGDALEWRLWVGKTPAAPVVSSASSNRAVVRSKSDGELLAGRSHNESQGVAEFSPPLPAYAGGAGLKRSSTLPASGYFHQDPHIPAPEVGWEALPWPAGNCGSDGSGIATSIESPSTPALSYSPSSTESSSGDRTIQMSSFIDIAPSPGRFGVLGAGDKGLPLSSEEHAAQHHHDVDPASGLSFLAYGAYHSGNVPFVYDPSAAPAPESLYSHWTL